MSPWPTQPLWPVWPSEQPPLQQDSGAASPLGDALWAAACNSAGLEEAAGQSQMFGFVKYLFVPY